MSNTLWQGLPREEIPWYPRVNYELCLGCRSCHEQCPHGVYEWDETQNRPAVAHPYECVVYCEACAKICPQGAIGFPPKQEIVALVKELRMKHAA